MFAAMNFSCFGGTEAYKNGICAACGIDRIYDLLRVLEVAVMRAGKHESRKFRAQVRAGLFCDNPFGTEQKKTHILLGHRRTEFLLQIQCPEHEPGRPSPRIFAA